MMKVHVLLGVAWHLSIFVERNPSVAPIKSGRRRIYKDMAQILLKYYRKILVVLSLPVILETYLLTGTGKEYGVGLLKKIILLIRFIKNNYQIKSASNFIEHLTMATRILNIPKNLKGCLVECGSFKGGSTANLSLLAEITGRTLEVFDSFQGLPKPNKNDRKHILVDLGEIHTYSQGSWSASLAEVKKNILKYGNIKVCNFHAGFFKKTLPVFDKRCVFIFLDVDLRISLETCLKYLWPRLENNGYLFTHEATHMEIASLFFDKDWWGNNLHCYPAGLIGSGCGLGLSPASDAFKSQLGYTVKNPQVKNFKFETQTGIYD